MEAHQSLLELLVTSQLGFHIWYSSYPILREVGILILKIWSLGGSVDSPLLCRRPALLSLADWFQYSWFRECVCSLESFLETVVMSYQFSHLIALNKIF